MPLVIYPMPLQVMTFNLRHASDIPPNTWASRRPVVSELLRRRAPDLIGTQEGLYAQLQDIARDRPEFSWIGWGREGGSRGEFAAIFYRTGRLQSLAFDHFWLSETPQVVGSKSWGSSCVRMATWVRFRDLQSGRDFEFWNTHLDHESQLARERGAALIVQRVREQRTSLPVVLAGDFNAEARANPAYNLFTDAGWSDTWFQSARRVEPDFASFHGYAAPVPDAPHIDWILTKGEVRADETRVVNFEIDGQYPSDHFPVMAALRIGEC